MLSPNPGIQTTPDSSAPSTRRLLLGPSLGQRRLSRTDFLVAGLWWGGGIFFERPSRQTQG